MKKINALFSALFLSIFLTTVPAAAEDELSKKKATEKELSDSPRFRIGVEKRAIHFAGVHSRDKDNNETTYHWRFNTAVMPSTDRIPALTLGYRVKEPLLLGSKLIFQSNRSKSTTFNAASNLGSLEGDTQYEQKDIFFAVAPYAAYWFKRDKIRPFIGAQVNFEYHRYKHEQTQSGERYFWVNKGLGIGGGLGTGIHFFVGEHVSLDTSLWATYRYGIEISDEKSVDYDNNSRYHAVELTGHLGISGWI